MFNKEWYCRFPVFVYLGGQLYQVSMKLESKRCVLLVIQMYLHVSGSSFNFYELRTAIMNTIATNNRYYNNFEVNYKSTYIHINIHIVKCPSLCAQIKLSKLLLLNISNKKDKNSSKNVRRFPVI